MAVLAGYPELGNTFDVRDLQGGLVTRVSHLQDRREQVKAVIRFIRDLPEALEVDDDDKKSLHLAAKRWL